MVVELFFDFKSPYSFIAIDAYFSLQKELEIKINWHAVSLPIEAMNKAYGNLKERTPLQINKAKYTYLDCRRLRPDLILKAPPGYFDTVFIGAAFEFAKEKGKGEVFIKNAFPKIFSRAFLLDDQREVLSLLEEIELKNKDFKASYEIYKDKVGKSWNFLVESGGFGIPTALFNEELFWGLDRLSLLKKRIEEMAA